MDSNICLFHAYENRTMAFCGPIRQERWNRISRPIDDMSRVAVSRVLGEGVFSYEYSWRTNSDIVGLWVGCLMRAGIEKWDTVRITHNIFDPCWLVGLELAVANIDARLRIPLPEAYMEFDINSQEMVRSPKRPCMIIRDNIQFYKEWPRMELSIKFLLRWRGIIEDHGKEWLTEYLKAYDAYIHPEVDFNDMDNVEFCLPNYDKTNRDRTAFEFPPGSKASTLHEASEIIMVFKKIN